MGALTSLLLVSLAVPAGTGPMRSRPPSHALGPAGAHPDWTAKKKRKAAAEPPAPVTITTDLPALELQIKKYRGTGILVKPNQQVTATFTGPGKLAVVVYQAVREEEAQPTEKVTVEILRNGKAEGSVSFKGKRDKSAKALGPEGPALTKPKSKTLKLPAGSAEIVVRVPHASTTAVVELQFYPGKSRAAAPITVAAATPVPAPETPPVAETPTPPEPPPTPPPELPPEPTPPVTETVAATPAAPQSEIERRIRAGELRDGEEGDYDRLTIADAASGKSESYARVTPEKPYVVWADGPGTLSLYVHRLATRPASPNPSDGLTILENDILLQSFELDTPLSPTLSVSGDEALSVTQVEEYKLNLGPKVARFAFQPAESARGGIAVRYLFEPGEKSGYMALALDLGDGSGGDLTMAAATTITEVAVREKVVQVEVEKIVQVGGEELVGLAAGGGVLAPQWRGNPAFGGLLEVRISLPFARRVLALSFEGGFFMQELAANIADPQGAGLGVKNGIISVPAIGALVVRFPMGKRVAGYISAGGGIIWTRATSDVGTTHDAASAWLPAARGLAGFEVGLGPGWLAIETGYLWTPTTDVGGVLDGYTPTGVPGHLRYRLGF